MRRSAALAGAALITLVLSACSALGGGGTQPLPATPPPTDQAPSTSVTAPSASSGQASSSAQGSSSAQASSSSAAPSTATQPTPADPGQPSPADQLGAPVATRISAASNAKVELTMYALVRNGSTSQLNFAARKLSSDTGYSVATTFSDGNADAGDRTGNTVDGVQLVDGKHAKLYLVASTGTGSACAPASCSASPCRRPRRCSRPPSQHPRPT